MPGSPLQPQAGGLLLFGFVIGLSKIHQGYCLRPLPRQKSKSLPPFRKFLLAITLNLREGLGQKDDLTVIYSPTKPRGKRPLVTLRHLEEALDMGEIAEFVEHGASKITPKMLQDIYRKLPMLRLKFAEIDDAKHPHLPEQLEFLSAVVEDFAEGVVDDIPYSTLASAVFALLYAHRQVDLIPDSIPEFGHTDDSAVVRAVLIQNEKILAEFAEKQGLVWEEITVNP